GASGKGRNQAELPRQGMHGPDASVSHAVGRRRNLVMDVAGGEHRSGATTDVALVKAALDAPLAVVQPPPYDDIHSKSLVGPGSREPVQLLKPRKTPKDFELSEIPPPLVADGSAYLGASCLAIEWDGRAAPAVSTAPRACSPANPPREAILMHVILATTGTDG